MTKKAIIIYHRADFDGICSYAIAKDALSRKHMTDPFPYTYRDEAPSAETLLRYDTVLIADVCLPADTMRALFHETQKRKGFEVLWIDHHKSSIELSVREGFSFLHGYREYEGKGACELTWNYFHGYNRVPLAIQYLSAYDVHDKERFDWEREVMRFQYGMREAYALRAEDFADDFQTIAGDGEFLTHMLENGGRLYRFEQENGSRGVSRFGFPVRVAGMYKGLCCLTSQFGSLAFESRIQAEGYELAVCANRIAAGTYIVSIYAPDKCALDIGRYLADTYGGGGHPGAGGCRVGLDTFIRLLEEGEI